MNAPERQQNPSLLTEQQYEILLRTRPEEERWQLIDGVATMMPPPTLRHQMIGGNLHSLLRASLERTRPDLAVLYESGLRIEGVPAFLPVPDLLVVEQPVGEGSYADRFFLTAEVLSDSNTQEYISLKIERYAQHPDNLYSLVVGQKDFHVELWSRESSWNGVVFRDGADVLELPKFGFRCALRDLYRGTPLA